MNLKCKLVSRLKCQVDFYPLFRTTECHLTKVKVPLSIVCVPVAVEDPALDPPVHHISAQHRAVMGVGVFLPLTLGHRFPAVVEHVL